MKRLNKLFKSKTIQNFFYLTLVQGSNFIIPLICFPYLIRILGADKFGLITFAQAIMYFFIVICDYGFNVSAVKEIAINKSNIPKVNEIYNNIISTKILLIFVTFLLLIISIFFVNKFNENYELIFFSFGMVIGQALLPIWFFQGFEDMKYITYFNLFSKIVFMVLIFWLVKSPENFKIVNLLNSFGNILSALFCFNLISKKYKIKYSVDSIYNITQRLKNDKLNFISNFSINIYINANIIILGFYEKEIIIGYYSIAEKILTASKQLITIIFYSIYSKVCLLANDSYSKLKVFLNKVTLILLVLFFTLGLVLFYGSEIICYFFSGNIFSETVLYIKLFSFTPLIIALNVPAYQTLLAFDKKKTYTFVLVLGSVINLVLSLILVPKYSALGTCVTIIITEIIITIGLHISVTFNFNKNGNRLHQILH